MNRIAAYALSIALLVGCTGAEDTSTDAATVIRQVVDRDRVLDLEEEIRIDGNRDDAPFYAVTAAALDSERRMLVLDVGNRQLLVFDSVGNRVGEIGRVGEGPGEFTSPRGMWVRGDTVAVSDGGNRFHLFRTTGEHLTTRAYRGVMDGRDEMMLSGVVATPHGWLTMATAYFRRDADGSDASLNPVMRNRLMRIDWEGDVEEAGFRLTHEPVGQMVGPFFVQPPFSTPPRWLWDGLGRIHLVSGAEYSIDVLDASARPLYRVENDYPVEPVTDRDLAEWRESRACAPGQPECDDARTELALRMEIPESKPVVARIVGFVNGGIAVMRTGTDPDPDDNLAMGEYDLFAPDGTILGRLPIGLSPRWFDGTTLVVTVWDEFLVPSMIRYRVVN